MKELVKPTKLKKQLQSTELYSECDTNFCPSDSMGCTYNSCESNAKYCDPNSCGVNMETANGDIIF